MNPLEFQFEPIAMKKVRHLMDQGFILDGMVMLVKNKGNTMEKCLVDQFGRVTWIREEPEETPGNLGESIKD